MSEKLTDDARKTIAFLTDGAAWGDEAATCGLALIETLLNDKAALLAALSMLNDAAIEYAVAMGAAHDDECPGDDTCACSFKPMHDRLGEAFRQAEIALDSEAVITPAPSLGRR